MTLIIGTDNDDTLPGTSKGDIIEGNGGNDYLQGLSGDDTLSGGTGMDNLHGGKGNDLLSGGSENDNLAGEAGNDSLEGGDGHDVLRGGDGNDLLIGGAGNDNLYGGAGADTFRFVTPDDSLFGSADIIFDFEHGVDKIDLRSMTYTSLATGHAPDTLRLTYSAASDRTYVRDDHSDFEFALKGDYRGILTNDDFLFRAPLGTVGYYEAAAGTGGNNTHFAAPITDLGYNAVSLDNLTASDLAGLTAVFLLNYSNEGYGSELLANMPALANYVANGGVLIIHDRYVDEAEAILPGLSGEDIVRDFSEDADVNFVNDFSATAIGPGGSLDDTSLDGGTSSNHGFAFDNTLHADIARVQTTSDPAHIVSFAYAYGTGAVYYSSIPLDHYLSEVGSPELNAAMKQYAENVLSWAVEGHHDLLNL